VLRVNPRVRALASGGVAVCVAWVWRPTRAIPADLKPYYYRHDTAAKWLDIDRYRDTARYQGYRELQVGIQVK